MTRMSIMITGAIVAIVTPMTVDGAIDFDRFRRLIDLHVSAGTDAVVVVGTTGESPTVTVEEHCELVRVAVEHAAKRIPIIAGTGANSTAEAIELTRCAKSVGAEACLSVVPYYNKPTQEGLYQHFRAVAEAVEIDQILYNVPGRTGADLSNETTLRLAQIPNIIGIKDATANLARGIDLLIHAPDAFSVYSGDDLTTLPLMLMGARGTVSVTANVAPTLMHQLCQAALKGDVEHARKINARLFPLHQALFVEPNPIPVKWALSQLGLIENVLRLPLTPLSEPLTGRVLSAMRHAGVI